MLQMLLMLQMLQMLLMSQMLQMLQMHPKISIVCHYELP